MGKLTAAERRGLYKETIEAIAAKVGYDKSTVGRARLGTSLRPETLNAFKVYLGTQGDGEQKVHWTQRPENRKRLLKNLKNMSLKRKELAANGNGNGTTVHSTETDHDTAHDPGTVANLPTIPLSQEEFQRHLIFCYGKVYGQIAAYSESIGVPCRDFARRMGQLLHSS